MPTILGEENPGNAEAKNDVQKNDKSDLQKFQFLLLTTQFLK
jgi:hypothetical protein